ncbi:hypothetical protein [Lentzea sp. NPDC003310]|uniref:hypothetical protein n=1 Tax=Lentzea sp. NPDC003310 TaxID=3154447 RepID=UPI0033A51BF3
MTDRRPDEVIDEAFFGWSLDTGEHTIVSSSLDARRAEMWRTRLQDHVRLQPVNGLEPPDVALSYLEFPDGHAAVVRRVREGFSEGRGNTHVLIGSVATLDAALALRLERWVGWKSAAPAGGMGTNSVHYLRSCAADAPEPPLDLVRSLEKQLVAVIAKILEYPAYPLSVIGCPETSRLPLLWAVRRAAENYLEREFPEHRRRWTFSTYEDRHGASIDNLPEIVFLPVVPSAGEAHRRLVVRFHEPVVDQSPLVEIAGHLVAGLLRSTPPPNRPPVPPPPVAPRPPEPRPSAAPADLPSGGVRVPPSTVPASAVAVDPAPPRGMPSNLKEQLTTPLLNARNVTEFLQELDTLAHVPDRAQLRAAFDADTVNRAAEFVEIDTRFQLLNRFLQTLYGADLRDLQGAPEAQKHAGRLIRTCQSEQLSLMLGSAAARHGRPEIAQRVLDRALQLGGPLKPGPRRRVRGVLPWAITRSQRVVLLALAAVLVLLTAVLSGYFLGQNESADPVVGAAPATTSAVVESARQEQVPQLKFGRAQVAADPARSRVFAFVTAEGRYFPQQPCTPSEDGNSTWDCAQTYVPPVKPGAPSELLAVVVPADQADGLTRDAEQRKGMPRAPEWVNQVPVRS